MKFTMRMPFTVVGGARIMVGVVAWYTARVVDKDGRDIGVGDECEGRSAISQEAANEIAVLRAKQWAARVRSFAGV